MPDNPKKILVVDDEETVRTVLQVELEQSGYVVTTGADGLEAMEHLRQQRFDLVILDIRMPNMDGIEVLRNIRTENLADIVVMLTGVGERKFLDESLKLGANDFLTKPVDLGVLYDCIDRVFK